MTCLFVVADVGLSHSPISLFRSPSGPVAVWEGEIHKSGAREKGGCKIQQPAIRHQMSNFHQKSGPSSPYSSSSKDTGGGCVHGGGAWTWHDKLMRLAAKWKPTNLRTAGISTAYPSYVCAHTPGWWWRWWTTTNLVDDDESLVESEARVETGFMHKRFTSGKEDPLIEWVAQ